MCECYQIGGRFIAEDPSCPIHGHHDNDLSEDDAIAILLNQGAHVLGAERPPQWMIEALREAAQLMVDRISAR